MAPELKSFLIYALTVAGRTTLRSFNMSASIVVSTRVNQLLPPWSFWSLSWAMYSRIWGLSRKCCILCNAQWDIITQHSDWHQDFYDCVSYFFCAHECIHLLSMNRMLCCQFVKCLAYAGTSFFKLFIVQYHILSCSLWTWKVNWQTETWAP